jgi:fumarate reductase flavoprotein subunit
MTYDLVVIGGGIAGWVAARRSQQFGMNVVLVDKATGGPGSNTRLSGGRIHAAYHHPHYDPDGLYAEIMKKTDGHARADVARAWADNVGRATDFLVAEGGEIARIGEPEYLWSALQPSRPVVEVAAAQILSQDEWKGRGPDRLLTRMREAFLAAGGTFRPGTRVVDLEADNGAVVGVRVETAERTQELIRGRAVVMADGGFQANRDLVATYITTHYKLRGASEDTGDCLQMALKIGARAVNMDAFYGHSYIRDDDYSNVQSYPAPTMLINNGIVVDGHGNRVGDEAMGTEEYSLIDDPLARNIARSETPGGCWAVFDHATWEGPGRQISMTPVPVNPTLVDRGGPFLTANSIAELAEQMGVPGDRLDAMVDAFNQFCRDGTPLDPPRSGRPRPMTERPFHAVPLIVGIMFAMGGVLVNGHGQVLDRTEQPIPGLYAAGGTMGGLQGGPHNGYSGGWSEAATFGLLVAEHAVGTTRNAAEPVAETAAGH